MKVKIQIEFEVEPTETSKDDHVGDIEESQARAAASMAAYDYLSLVKISGHGTDTESVEVHVDGFGPCKVSLGTDHD